MTNPQRHEEEPETEAETGVERAGGRLMRPFAVALQLSSYWIVCPRAAAMLPKVKQARAWLLAEAAADLRRLKTLPGAAA